MDKDEAISEKITDIYYKHKGIYGYRRITIELNRAGYRINHKKVYRIMKEEELYAVIRKKNRQKAAAMGVMKVAEDKLRRGDLSLKLCKHHSSTSSRLYLKFISCCIL